MKLGRRDEAHPPYQRIIADLLKLVIQVRRGEESDLPSCNVVGITEQPLDGERVGRRARRPCDPAKTRPRERRTVTKLKPHFSTDDAQLRQARQTTKEQKTQRLDRANKSQTLDGVELFYGVEVADGRNELV